MAVAALVHLKLLDLSCRAWGWWHHIFKNGLLIYVISWHSNFFQVSGCCTEVWHMPRDQKSHDDAGLNPAASRKDKIRGFSKRWPILMACSRFRTCPTAWPTPPDSAAKFACPRSWAEWRSVFRREFGTRGMHKRRNPTTWPSGLEFV